jgi:hypothetical protein
LITPNFAIIEIFEWTWGMQIISIPASSHWEHVSKIPQDIHWGFCFTDRSKKLQEKHLEVQFNSQDVFGYILGFNYTSKDKAFTISKCCKAVHLWVPSYWCLALNDSFTKGLIVKKYQNFELTVLEFWGINNPHVAKS